MILTQLDKKYQDIKFYGDWDCIALEYAKFYVENRIKDVKGYDIKDELERINTFDKLIGYIKYSEWTDCVNLGGLVNELIKFAMLKVELI